MTMLEYRIALRVAGSTDRVTQNSIAQMTVIEMTKTIS